MPSADSLIVYIGYSTTLAPNCTLTLRYNDHTNHNEKTVVTLAGTDYASWSHTAITIPSDTLSLSVQVLPRSQSQSQQQLPEIVKGTVHVTVVGHVNWLMELQALLAHLLCKCAGLYYLPLYVRGC